MKLKDYQRDDVLAPFERYLTTLAEKKHESDDFVAFQKSKGKIAASQDWCRGAWDELRAEKRIPPLKLKDESLVTPDYIARTDSLGRPIPNVCLKVPTGGGKTLLGCVAVETLLTQFYRRQSGLVLWVVPTDSIYRQTWKVFANRESSYRQMLERASGGRVKLLEKDDTFTADDTRNQLCIMLLMLQSGAVRTDSQDKRKIFQDSGRYPSFFPEVDDAVKTKELLKAVPNLDTPSTDDPEYRADQPIVKQSLTNVFRLVRPLVIMDEGHKAYGQASFEFLTGFSPSFILELSATPNSGSERISNVLVSVSGAALKKEEMIKLPINIENVDRADWKHTLASAQQRLEDLQRSAKRYHGETNRYIRPILLVRVERTGKDQRDKNLVHAEDARDHLIGKLGAKPEEIRVKSSETDEIGDEDLLSDTCPVRYIITKDALREGWDCPFAYVLAVLSRTTAKTALTQMVGRVLRQPYAQSTNRPDLNESYVFTFDQEVSEAVEGVKTGLADEGMADLVDQVRGGTSGKVSLTRREKILRRNKWRGVRVFLPRVLATDLRGNWRPFDYDRDLLSSVDWSKLSFSDRATYTPEAHDAMERTLTRVNVEKSEEGTELTDNLVSSEAEATDGSIDLAYLTRLLLDVIPNPWHSTRILEETLDELRKRKVPDKRIYTNRMILVKAMRDDLREQVNAMTEALFRSMLAENKISFRLEVSNDPVLNWALAEILEIDVTDEDHLLKKKNGADLDKHLFEKIYQKQVNGLEKGVAWYLDDHAAVTWWHRIAVHQDWHLQGWQRSRVYPDFLVCLDSKDEGSLRFSVLESKGLHLKGNDDTEYKRKLFELLTKHSATEVSVGELKLGLKQAWISFELLLEADWEQKVGKALSV